MEAISKQVIRGCLEGKMISKNTMRKIGNNIPNTNSNENSCRTSAGHELWVLQSIEQQEKSEITRDVDI